MKPLCFKTPREADENAPWGKIITRSYGSPVKAECFSIRAMASFAWRLITAVFLTANSPPVWSHPCILSESRSACFLNSSTAEDRDRFQFQGMKAIEQVN